MNVYVTNYFYGHLNYIKEFNFSYMVFLPFPRPMLITGSGKYRTSRYSKLLYCISSCHYITYQRVKKKNHLGYYVVTCGVWIAVTPQTENINPKLQSAWFWKAHPLCKTFLINLINIYFNICISPPHLIYIDWWVANEFKNILNNHCAYLIYIKFLSVSGCTSVLTIPLLIMITFHVTIS